MEAKELTKLAVKALEDKKGEDIRVIDIHGVSVLADYFVIADGSNASQVKAMADNVEEAGDPALLLHTDKLFASLREKLSTGWFNDLLKDLLLAEPVQVIQKIGRAHV